MIPGAVDGGKSTYHLCPGTCTDVMAPCCGYVEQRLWRCSMEIMCIFAAIDILTRQDIFSTVDFAAAQTMQHAQNGHSFSGRLPTVNMLCRGSRDGSHAC